MSVIAPFITLKSAMQSACNGDKYHDDRGHRGRAWLTKAGAA